MSTPAGADPTDGSTAAGPAGPDPVVERVAGPIRAFVADHGGNGQAVISYLGRGGARIVVVSGDGPFTDAVVDDMAVAEAICAAAGLKVGAWDRELTSRITVSHADRVRMAGTGR